MHLEKKDFTFIIFLIVIVFGVYWRTFNYELIWDSKSYLEKNANFFEDNSLGTVLKSEYLQQGSVKSGIYFRPIVTASFWIESRLWGLRNITLRLINLIIYVLSLAILFLFFKKQSEAKYFPEIATLLFALYPLNVDNVVWVVSRCDLFLLLWGGLVFLFLELFVRKGKHYFWMGSSFFYLLGILSKEAFLFFLPILFLYELVKRKKIFLPYHLLNVSLTFLFFVVKLIFLKFGNFRLLLYSGLAENLKMMLVSIGYYFRSMLFPLKYDLFLPLADIVNLKYAVFGLLFILVFFYLVWNSIKNKEILIPVSFILVFFAGHLYLIFTPLFPFKIYSRYMMIPGLGFIWIFTHYLGRLKDKVKFILAFILLFSFIPSVILNSLSYKTELGYFRRADKSSPNNDFITYKIAQIYHENNDFLSSELFLNKSLSLPLKKETAMFVSLLYANIEFIRADYEKTLKWIESIKSFKSPYLEIVPMVEYQINHQRGLVFLARGNVELAEKCFKENIEKYKDLVDPYLDLHALYVSHNRWEEAGNFEQVMKKRFKSLRVIDTIQIKNRFERATLDEKIAFFILYKNYSKAIGLIQQLSPLDLDHKLLLSKCFYWIGKAEDGARIIHEIYTEHSNDYKILNTIGFFYLKTFIRIDEALFYYRKSLEIYKEQPQLAYFIFSTTNGYLNKIKKVW